MKTKTFQDDVLPLKDMLFRLALHITQERQRAEDVVQETLLKIWNRRDQWDQIESMEAFAATLCRNRALDMMRQEERRQQLFSTPDGYGDYPSAAANPEQQAVESDRVSLVRQLISQLPERLSTAMHLRDIEGKSYKEIADIMDVSEQQVKTYIFRARQTVRQKFVQRDNYGL